MKFVKKTIKWVLYLLTIPLVYLIVSLALTAITVNTDSNVEGSHIIYLNTNGVHLDFILHTDDLHPKLLDDLSHQRNDMYFSFGWGDENFYLNTPTWGDLTFSNACKALLWNSSTLVHLTKYTQIGSDWIAIRVTDVELENLNNYLLATFIVDTTGHKVLLIGQGYGANDDFYKANGNYTCLNTCNSWVNSAFKKSGLKACYWTPFDFGLMSKYR